MGQSFDTPVSPTNAYDLQIYHEGINIAEKRVVMQLVELRFEILLGS